MPDQEAAVDRLLRALAHYQPDSFQGLAAARIGIAEALHLLGVPYARTSMALDAHAARRAEALSSSRGILQELEQGKRAAAGHEGSTDTPR